MMAEVAESAKRRAGQGIFFEDNDTTMAHFEDDPVKVTGRDPPPPAASFYRMPLSDHLKRNMIAAGLHRPTPCQRHACAVVMAGRDLLLAARSGSGKTAAYLVPLMARVYHMKRLATRNRAYPAALVLVPTRELAAQVYEAAASLASRSHISVVRIVGGVPLVQQKLEMRGGCDVIIGTPGRVAQLVEGSIIRLSRVAMVVIDEADFILASGLDAQLRSLRTSALAQGETPWQTVLVGATFSEVLLRFAEDMLQDHIYVQVGMGATSSALTQRVLLMSDQDKEAELLRLLQADDGATLVITGDKRRAERLAAALSASGVAAAALHGGQATSEREEALSLLRFGMVRALVSTPLIGRGAELDDLRNLVLYDMPRRIDEYINQVGRVGRGGRVGHVIGFFTPANLLLAADLVRVLEEGQQVVPGFLRDFASPNAQSRIPPSPSMRFRRVGGRVTRLLPFGSYLLQAKEEPRQSGPRQAKAGPQAAVPAGAEALVMAVAKGSEHSSDEGQLDAELFLEKP